MGAEFGVDKDENQERPRVGDVKEQVDPTANAEDGGHPGAQARPHDEKQNTRCSATYDESVEKKGSEPGEIEDHASEDTQAKQDLYKAHWKILRR
jgi:hypothetical protein